MPGENPAHGIQGFIGAVHHVHSASTVNVWLDEAWSDEHLHSFHIHGREYGSSGAPTREVRLRDLRLHRGERFRYVYDFGAYWECDIRLEAVLPLTPRRVYPVCIGGKRAAPPEDCRGAWGYLERLD